MPRPAMSAQSGREGGGRLRYIAAPRNQIIEIEGRVQTPGLFSFQPNGRLEGMMAVGQNECPTLAQQAWGTRRNDLGSRAFAFGTVVPSTWTNPERRLPQER